MDLFNNNSQKEMIVLPMPDAEVCYYPNFYNDVQALEFQQKILNETAWQEDNIKLFGKTYKQPRLTALYGDSDKTYTYSNIKMAPNNWTPTLFKIKEEIENLTKEKFTTVLLNLYRDGSDSNGWHSDDEKELGKHPFIASLSFGAKRTFHFKHKQDTSLKFKIDLGHGSLLLMGGATQENWKHQIPKSKRVLSSRINLTFRKIKGNH